MKPNEIKIGLKVDYHNIIGGPVTLSNCTIRTDPHYLPGSGWVIWLHEKSGCVSIEQLTPVEENDEN